MWSSLCYRYGRICLIVLLLCVVVCMLQIRKDMFNLSTSVCGRLCFMLQLPKDMFYLSTSVCDRLYATDTEGYV